MLRRMRTLFTSRDGADYDGDRPRDPYMDVLREMQAPNKPPQPSLSSAVAGVFRRLVNPRGHSTPHRRM